MKDEESITLHVTVPKSKLNKIKAWLKKEGITVKILSSQLPYGMRKGNYKKGEKPSQFAGAWADREELNADELRRKAWGNRGVK